MRKREILVIAVVVALGACLAAPCLISRREQSRRDVCEFRLMFLALGGLRCNELEGQFPGYENKQGVNFKGETVATGWAFRVMPYVGFETKGENQEFLQQAAAKSGIQQLGHYKQALADFGDSEDAAQQGDIPQFRFAALLCPADVAKHNKNVACSFVANCGMPDRSSTEFPADWAANGIFFDRFESEDSIEISVPDIAAGDGADQTLLFGENVDAGKWTDHKENLVGMLWAAGGKNAPKKISQPVYRINEKRGLGDGSYRFARPSSHHTGGANVAFASGRTQFLNEKMAPLVYAQLMAPDDLQAKYPGTEFSVDFESLSVSDP